MIELETGTPLGRYELLTELGRGGMASVWVAREVSGASGKQRLVALKIMLPELARDSTFRAMFLEEGQIVRSIEHDNVVQIYEVAESQGLLYMAMEWVEGDSLRTVIKEAKQRRAIPPEMAVRIMADTAAGLHAAHELRGWDGELRGIVHCDVSPHNILIGPVGEAKLVDFGVAHAASHTELEDGNENIRGKFGYMSPEQALGRRVDRRSDLFSMGIVLFELTTGERLFRGEDAPHTLKLIASGPIPRPSSIIPSYPAALETIVLRCLERDVSKRFQTADELRDALEQYLVDARILVSHAGVGKLVKRVLGARMQKRRAAIAAALRALGDPDAPRADAAPDTPGSVSATAPAPSVGAFTPSDSPTAWQDAPTSAPQRRRGALVYLVVALLLISSGAAAAAIVLVRPRVSTAASTGIDIDAGGRSAPGWASATARAQQAAPEGASIDSLPSEQALPGQPVVWKRRKKQVDSTETANRSRPGHAGTTNPSSAESAAAQPATTDSAAPEPPALDYEPIRLPPVPATDIPMPDEPDYAPNGNASRASGRSG